MTVQTFYRIAVWLPLVVPAIVAIGVHVLGFDPDGGPLVKIVQLLLMSGVYGGPVYLLVAAWATWWIDSRPEREIQRRALMAPLLMLAAWIALAVILSAIFGEVRMFAALAGLGAVMIVGLGYLYVALVFFLRRWFEFPDGSRPSSMAG